VVLSSEEFARAIQANVEVTALQRLAEAHDVELAFTLTPLRKRVSAELQELVKQGQALNLEAPHAYLPLFAHRPGLRPDFVARWVDLAAWRKIHLVRADKDRPEQIFDAFERMLDCRLSRPGADRSGGNVRWPYVQTLVMSLLNNAAKQSPVEQRRRAAVDAYGALEAALDDVAGAQYPALPGPIAHIADMIWYAQEAHVRHLVDSGRAVTYGGSPDDGGAPAT
jgi:hypothetical protein